MEAGSRATTFHEEQRLSKWWLWAVGLPTLALCIGGYVAAIVATLRQGPVSTGDIVGMAIAGACLVAGCAAVGALHFARLVVEVRGDGLWVKFSPIHRSSKRIPLERALSVASVTYRPILRYGGWGIRYTWKGKAYNVSGNRGVRIDFDSGRHLLLGSQRPDELAAAIERVAPGVTAARGG